MKTRSKKVKDLEKFLKDEELTDNEATFSDTQNKKNNSKKVRHLSESNTSEEIIKTYRKNLWSCCFKRVFDIIFALFFIILSSPLMLAVAILVKIKLGGPVFFNQYRPGKNNKIFKLYKFRTMTNAKDADGNFLPDSERMTKFGNALRKTSLDELPQLFNILKGDMSVVGPRPKLVKDMVFYSEDQNVRALVRPGLTGLAQVNGRNNITWEEVFEYDKTYVKKIGLVLDFRIFLKTIWKVLFRKDVVVQDQVVQNYYYGNYLLETNQITEEEFLEKQKHAEELINEVKNK